MKVWLCFILLVLGSWFSLIGVTDRANEVLPWNDAEVAGVEFLYREGTGGGCFHAASRASAVS